METGHGSMYKEEEEIAIFENQMIPDPGDRSSFIILAIPFCLFTWLAAGS